VVPSTLVVETYMHLTGIRHNGAYMNLCSGWQALHKDTTCCRCLIRPNRRRTYSPVPLLRLLQHRSRRVSRVAAYLRSFGGDRQASQVSIREAAAHGLDWPYVSWIKALIVVRFCVTPQVNGPTSSGRQSSMAARWQEVGFPSNPAVLFGLSVRPKLSYLLVMWCVTLFGLAHAYCVLMPRR
jgi:hypothetical protein